MRHELNTLFADTVSHSPVIGSTVHGAPIYGAPAALPARVVRRQRTVVGKSGEVAVSRAQVYLRDPVAVSLNDRFELSDGSTVGPALAIDELPDDTGQLFVKVYL